MYGAKTIRVSLERDIESAAMRAASRARQFGREVDHTVEGWRSPPMRGWFVTASRRGEDFNYFISGMEWPYVFVLSPKGQSAKPLNVSGLSLADRRNLLDALEQFEANRS